MANMYFYCPNCGYYEIKDKYDTSINVKVVWHCGECSSKMITHCLNPTCPILIENLTRKCCPCGTEYPNIEKANNREDSEDHSSVDRGF